MTIEQRPTEPRGTAAADSPPSSSTAARRDLPRGGEAEGRLYELDLVRFIAAMMLVMYHYTFRGSKLVSADVWFPGLGQVWRYGDTGVQLFFLVSGFVILRTAWNRRPTDFVISRMVRLYPAFWFCVTVTAVAKLLMGTGVYPWDVHLGQYLWNLTMLQEFVGVKSIDGVYWSLSTELKFYTLIFIVLLFRKIEHIRWVLAGWLAASIVLLFYPHHTIVHTLLAPEFSAYFIAGAVFYLIYRDGVSLDKVLLVAASLGVSLLCAWRAAIGSAAGYHQVIHPEINVTIIALFYGVFCLLAWGKTDRLRSPFFVTLGLLTYPLYLIHQYLGFMLMNHLHLYVNKYVLLVLLTSFMLAFAYLIHRYVERPFSGRLKTFLTRVAASLVPRRPSPGRAGGRVAGHERIPLGGGLSSAAASLVRTVPKYFPSLRVATNSPSAEAEPEPGRE